MGTRGAYGYRIDGEDKVTYNHYDSYPDELGSNIIGYASQMELEKMREVAKSIVLVNGNEDVEKKLIERYKSYADLGVADGTYKSWYCLLRNTQGDLQPYHGKLEHMIDSHELTLGVRHPGSTRFWDRTANGLTILVTLYLRVVIQKVDYRWDKLLFQP